LKSQTAQVSIPTGVPIPPGTPPTTPPTTGAPHPKPL
jgi:hypothetical protein